jgi:predicted O-methyltransferase YrrM
MNIEKAKLLDGWMYDIDLWWIANQASLHSNILELGVYAGRSTRAICDSTKGKVTCVDNWNTPALGDLTYIHDLFRLNLADHITAGKLRIFHANTDVALKHLIDAGERFDFIFIDADHNYEPVKADILGCLKLLSPGGIISGHDYNWDGVKKAVDELLPKHELTNYIWYERI